MIPIFMHLGPYAGRFWHRFGFAHVWKARSEHPGSAFAPFGRFSAWYGRLSRCAKLEQNTGHQATNLLRRDRTLPAFPLTLDGEFGLSAQQELIAGTGHDPTPAFYLLRGAQVRVFPEQVLLEEAMAMLLREAFTIPGAHLLQGGLLAPYPDEPTFVRVAFGVTGGF